MDAPVDGVTAVHVRITSMWIKPTGGPAVQLALTNTPLNVNLLALTDTNAAILINEAVIEPGSYEWLAMDIAAERNVRDSYVLTETGGEEEIELRVPSGRVRLVSGFDVPAESGPALAVRLGHAPGPRLSAGPRPVSAETGVPHARRHRVRRAARHDRRGDCRHEPSSGHE